jgi:DNA polymerase-3 subunit delta'
MNISAANALLKTLEEPQGDTCMILVTDHAARLPATIRSRCQSLDVRLPSGPLALEWLARECGIDEAKGRMALAAAAGSPLRARDLEADGSVGLFIGLAERLDALQAQRGIAGAPISDWLELDERRLWTWLSLHAASRMREVSSSNPAAAGLSRLQLEADRNRALMSTPVRKDLLLQNWLIQWCQLRV